MDALTFWLVTGIQPMLAVYSTGTRRFFLRQKTSYIQPTQPICATAAKQPFLLEKTKPECRRFALNCEASDGVSQPWPE